MSHARSEAVIALGKKLSACLKDDGDAAAAWLSHLLAEKIDAAEHDHGPAKLEAERAAVDLTLELWRHRASFPDPSRPFGDIAPILRALESLDVGRTERRYFSRTFHTAERVKLSEAGANWLEVAHGVDHLARLTIKLCLAAALDTTDGEAEAWATLAEEATVDDQPGGVVIRFVAEGEDVPSDEDIVRQERVDKLRAFISLAEDLLAGMAPTADQASVALKLDSDA